MAEVGTLEARREPVTTTYHGVEVTEDYRWLEDAASEETKAWTLEQHERTIAYLRALPSYDDIRRRAEAILRADSTSYDDLRRGGQAYFALENRPPR
ncbi:MAG TPA: S9 family peptidase, partial [Actinomycetota bacterium]|nr:S9 family peptidase [Actinomycetota bacterium]